jgi:hypothetical protein
MIAAGIFIRIPAQAQTIIMTSMYQYTKAVISICPQLPKKDAKLPPYNKNIVITDNEFHLFDYPILYALSVDGIEFSSNRLIRSHDFEPFHPRKDGLTFEYCRNVTVKGNTVEGEVLGNTIHTSCGNASQGM